MRFILFHQGEDVGSVWFPFHHLDKAEEDRVFRIPFEESFAFALGNLQTHAASEFDELSCRKNTGLGNRKEFVDGHELPPFFARMLSRTLIACFFG